MIPSTELTLPPAKPSAVVRLARVANLTLAALLACCLVLQIFFAGAGALVSPSYWPLHRAFGYSLQWLAIAMPLVGLLARLPKRGHALNALAFVLIWVQYALIWLPGRGVLPVELRGLHAVNALALFTVTALNARLLWQLLRIPDTPTQARAGHTVPANNSSMSSTPSPLAILVGCMLLIVLSMIACPAIAFLSWRVVGGAPDTGLSAQQASAPPNSAHGGQVLFERRCSSCHSAGSGAKYGPGLAGLFETGGPTLPDGVDYDGKLPNGNDITEANVAAWIRAGGRGQIGQMPPHDLSDAEMVGLIAYLKTLKR